MIVDQTHACLAYNGNRRPRTQLIDRVIVHRFGEVISGWPERITSALEAARAWAEHPELVALKYGGNIYEFVIAPDGTISQWFPLEWHGAHAKDASWTGIGIACLGDFRAHRMPQPQFDALVWLCRVLWGAFGCAVVGHDEVPGGSDDPEKRCPGDLLSMGAVRRAVRDASGPPESLEAAGIRRRM